MIGLLDGNNFFVSCEQVFQPKLLGKPVIVLSNAGGCVIARSPEAKALGIAMGAPYFQIESLVKAHGVATLSSNFELYQDMHRRMMTYLKSQVPEISVYSVDEAFFKVAEDDEDNRRALGTHLRQNIYQRMGLPVSIGFGPTKALAKGANYFAKRVTSSQGVVDLGDPGLRPLYLKNLPIGEVWGIGRRYGAFLKKQNVLDALTFAEKSPDWVLKHMTIVGARLQQELLGTPTYGFYESADPQKSLTVSRSFGHPIHNFQELQEALCFFVARAGEKLRRQGLWARGMTILLMTSGRGTDGFLSFEAHGHFPEPVQHTKDFLQMARNLCQQAYRGGYPYRKAGVYLYDFYGAGERQIPLPMDAEPSVDGGGARPLDVSLTRTEEAMDGLNGRFGRNTLFYGAQGIAPTWAHLPTLRSKRWTTRFDELLTVG